LVTVSSAPALSTFQQLLHELFQTDDADLDFGFYRLLRLKRSQIDALITEQLPRRVRAAFEASGEEEHKVVALELEELAGQVRDQIADTALLADGSVNPEHRDQKARLPRELIAKYETQEAKKELMARVRFSRSEDVLNTVKPLASSNASFELRQRPQKTITSWISLPEAGRPAMR